ncbi:MAG: hypothetical protein ACRD96_12680 [Bryobacteraceae bacterium]
MGRRQEALKMLAILEARTPPADFQVALVCTGLGEFNTAFDRLEKARLAKDMNTPYLNIDPRFAPLRSDPRYSQLLKRIGL